MVPQLRRRLATSRSATEERDFSDVALDSAAAFRANASTSILRRSEPRYGQVFFIWYLW